LKEIGASFRGGANRSRQRRNATVSPSRAFSIALRVSASCSPSRSASIASVTLCRLPFRQPPSLLPGANLPSVLLPPLFGTLATNALLGDHAPETTMGKPRPSHQDLRPVEAAGAASRRAYFLATAKAPDDPSDRVLEVSSGVHPVLSR